MRIRTMRVRAWNRARCFATFKIPSTLEQRAISILSERGYAYPSVSIDPFLVFPLTWVAAASVATAPERR